MARQVNEKLILFVSVLSIIIPPIILYCYIINLDPFSFRPPFSASPSPRNSAGPPRLAYFVSGSAGEGEMLKRTLQAVYHPHNLYIVHLDQETPLPERQELFDYIGNHSVFSSVGNVRTITRANLVTRRGPTVLANILHAAAILLKEGGDWDWFINLSAADYPLVTQDDLLYVMSLMPRHLNFIESTSNLGWKKDRAKMLIIDPALYMSEKVNPDVLHIRELRELPDAFKLYTGSPWMGVTRSFIEYCIWGLDNLPRTVLMYHANYMSPTDSYFQTVICNSEFRNTTVNTDLHFVAWHDPPHEHPRDVTFDELVSVIDSNAPFARKFTTDGEVLDWIDRFLLERQPGRLVPGGWCCGPRLPPMRKGVVNPLSVSDPCSVVGNKTYFKPGAGARRLQRFFYPLLFDPTLLI